MSLYRRKGSPYWYTDIWHEGRRIRRPTGTTNKEEARRVLNKIIAALPKPTAQDGPTWDQAVDEWLAADDRDMEDRYRLRWVGTKLGNPALSSITPKQWTALLASKRAEKASRGTTSGGTCKRYWNLIRAVLYQAKRAGWVTAVPVLQKIKTPPGRLRWLTHDQWDRLRACEKIVRRGSPGGR